MSSGLARSQTLAYCLFCGTRQPGTPQTKYRRRTRVGWQSTGTAAWLADPVHLCTSCGTPLPRPDADILRQATGIAPANEPMPLRRGLALAVHAHWPLEPMAASLDRLTPDGLQFQAPEAFVAEQLLKVDGSCLRMLARVIDSRPAAPGYYLTKTRSLAARLDPLA